MSNSTERAAQTKEPKTQTDPASSTIDPALTPIVPLDPSEEMVTGTEPERASERRPRLGEGRPGEECDSSSTGPQTEVGKDG